MIGTGYALKGKSLQRQNRDMTLGESCIYRKEIDWSLLHEGLTVPVRLQIGFKALLDGYERGVGKPITLLLEGQPYDAKLINQKFDREKYRDHTDVVQIRYSKTSPLSQKLRQLFSSSYTCLKNEREKYPGKQARLPEDAREYFVLYMTADPSVFAVEAITRQEVYDANVQLAGVTEEEFEHSINYARADESASIVTRQQLVKIRRLDRSIGENLKVLYEHRCQVCAADFGKPYERHVAEVHHIIQFVHSMNNDYDNLMVLCPNHHTVIHKATPEFDRHTLTLSYSNGYQEKLMLDKHFNIPAAYSDLSQ